MKTKKSLGILLLFIVASAFSFLSCVKDDEIDIDLLTGEWHVLGMIDSSLTYKINADKTCSIHIRHLLPPKDTIINRTYVVSKDNSLISLFNEYNKRTEQYQIVKLTQEEMRWKNASPGDGNSDMKLVKDKADVHI